MPMQRASTDRQRGFLARRSDTMSRSIRRRLPRCMPVVTALATRKSIGRGAAWHQTRPSKRGNGVSTRNEHDFISLNSETPLGSAWLSRLQKRNPVRRSVTGPKARIVYIFEYDYPPSLTLKIAPISQPIAHLTAALMSHPATSSMRNHRLLGLPVAAPEQALRKLRSS
jgi:hypothetical protein